MIGLQNLGLIMKYHFWFILRKNVLILFLLFANIITEVEKSTKEIGCILINIDPVCFYAHLLWDRWIVNPNCLCLYLHFVIKLQLKNVRHDLYLKSLIFERKYFSMINNLFLISMTTYFIDTNFSHYIFFQKNLWLEHFIVITWIETYYDY
jgi:hypothetical protein